MIKIWSWVCIGFLLAGPVMADTPPPGTVKLKGGTDGTTIGNTGDALKTTASISGPITVSGPLAVTGTFWQATQPVSGNLGRVWSLLNSLDSVTSYQGGAWSVDANITNSSLPVTGTFWQATQPVSIASSVPVTGTFFQATQPVSAVSLPLPSGAATESTLSTLNGKVTAVDTGNVSVTSSALPSGAATASNQATGNSSLATIASNTSGVATASNQTTGNSSLSSIDGKITAVNTGAVVVASSALPSGASTSALQGTGNASLASIDGKITAVNTGAVVVSSSALPSGAASASNQATAIASLASIDSKLSSPVTVTQTAIPAATGRSSVNLARNAYASINVTTAAYVQLIASTSDVTNMVEVFDSSGQTLLFAVGGAGSEVDKFYIVPGGNGQVPLAIPAGSRVSVKAVSGTASSGELDITLYK